MTCIVGVVDGSKVWIGGDSAGVSGQDMRPRADAKVFNNGRYAMGFTSSFRMGQLLQHNFVPPEPPAECDLHVFMVREFIAALRPCLAEGGFRKKDNDVETGGTFLVGIDGRLFNIDIDFHVGESRDKFDACGCGEPYALGALAATWPGAAQPQDRIRHALTVAETYSTGVRGPFTVVHSLDRQPSRLDAPLVMDEEEFWKGASRERERA